MLLVPIAAPAGVERLAPLARTPIRRALPAPKDAPLNDTFTDPADVGVLTSDT